MSCICLFDLLWLVQRESKNISVPYNQNNWHTQAMKNKVNDLNVYLNIEYSKHEYRNILVKIKRYLLSEKVLYKTVTKLDANVH